MPFLRDPSLIAGTENRPEPGCGKPATLSALAALCGSVRRLASSLEERPDREGEKPLWALLGTVLGGGQTQGQRWGWEGFFPDVCPGQAERLAVLLGAKVGGCLACRLGRLGAAPTPPIIVKDKKRKEKGDNLWQNQENEIKL